ncbi:MAG TPA: SDR family oxidoreductase [Thermoanaerobaculia bacterium]|nr:SDR family oxidoreductase [Thermoanaerobaculia bacterium]
MRFSGKTIVVAGGTGGIGSEVARGVVSEGGNVLLVARDPRKLDERVAELDALAGRDGAAASIVADAGSLAALSAAAADAVARYGRLDGWVHAVGSILLKPLSATSEDDWARQLDLNAGSAFRALQAALGPMRKQRGGSIVLFGSAAASVGLPNHAAIAAAKAAVVGLARSAAMDLARYGIRVNVVSPGLVRTPMSSAITGNETSLKVSQAMHPTGRISEPADVAAAVLYLLSDGAANVTGALLPVDGGMAAGRPPAMAS